MENSLPMTKLTALQTMLSAGGATSEVTSRQYADLQQRWQASSPQQGKIAAVPLTMPSSKHWSIQAETTPGQWRCDLRGTASDSEYRHWSRGDCHLRQSLEIDRPASPHFTSAKPEGSGCEAIPFPREVLG